MVQKFNMKINLITQHKNLRGKKVLLRVDFNVALKAGRVVDDFRIVRSLPTIKYLLKQNCQIVIISHLGRPKGKANSSLSLAPVVNQLRKHLRSKKIHFIKDKVGKNLIAKVNKSKPKRTNKCKSNF